jgi:hypothetical protein
MALSSHGLQELEKKKKKGTWTRWTKCQHPQPWASPDLTSEAVYWVAMNSPPDCKNSSEGF